MSSSSVSWCFNFHLCQFVCFRRWWCCFNWRSWLVFVISSKSVLGFSTCHTTQLMSCMFMAAYHISICVRGYNNQRYSRYKPWGFSLHKSPHRKWYYITAELLSPENNITNLLFYLKQELWVLPGIYYLFCKVRIFLLPDRQMELDLLCMPTAGQQLCASALYSDWLTHVSL